MIAEEKRKAVLAAIEQVQDEAAFAKIAAAVTEILTPAQPATQHRPGFMQGTVTYLMDDWDAPLPDSDWKHNASA